jgi:hypothetical protein
MASEGLPGVRDGLSAKTGDRSSDPVAIHCNVLGLQVVQHDRAATRGDNLARSSSRRASATTSTEDQRFLHQARSQRAFHLPQEAVVSITGGRTPARDELRQCLRSSAHCRIRSRTRSLAEGLPPPDPGVLGCGGRALARRAGRNRPVVQAVVTGRSLESEEYLKGITSGHVSAEVGKRRKPGRFLPRSARRARVG